jgi:polyisoprenoid-binding protein YceI
MKLAQFASPVVTFALLAVAAPAVLAQTTTWKSDPAHSEVDFSIVHMSLSNVHGRFGTVDATIVSDSQDVTKSTVKATIHMDGINTGVAARDNDLKSEKYFNVAQYPTATFASTSIAKGGSGLTVNGNLTIKGVTKPVVLDVSGPTGPVQGMDKKQHEGFNATTTIHRSDFGIGAGLPTAVLSEDVKLTIELDVAKQ